MIRRPPRSTLFPTRRSSDLHAGVFVGVLRHQVHPVWRFAWLVVVVLRDRKSTRLNSSHGYISYAVFCLKKKKTFTTRPRRIIRIRRLAQTHTSVPHFSISSP